MEYTSRAIPAAIKRQVVVRDGLVCQWCAIPVVRGGVRSGYRSNQLHFDHVKPWAAGGDHTLENLVVSCAGCNLSRAKPGINLRATHTWVEYRYGKYWWPEGYTPPRLVDPDRCAQLLGEVAHRRLPALAIVQMVHRGAVPATGPGEPVYVDMPEVVLSKAERRRMGR